MNKSISIVIPVFNEANRIHLTFEALQELRLPSGFYLKEVILTNDGSTDSTLTKLIKFKKVTNLPIVIVSYPKNMGKGFAVKKAMLMSKADYTLLCDADISTPLSELSKFVKHVEKGDNIVIGTRKNGKSTVSIRQPLARELLGKSFTQLTRFILQMNVSDFTCGFKLFSKNAVKSVFTDAKINGWGYDAEILFIAKNNNFDIVECPVKWSDVKDSHVKVGTAIFRTLGELFKIRYNHMSGQIGSIKDIPSIDKILGKINI